MDNEKNTNSLDEVISKLKNDLSDAAGENGEKMNTSADIDGSLGSEKTTSFSFAEAGAKAGAALDTAAERGGEAARNAGTKLKDGLMEHGIDTGKLASKLAEDMSNVATAVGKAGEAAIGKLKEKLDEIDLGGADGDGDTDDADGGTDDGCAGESDEDGTSEPEGEETDEDDSDD